MTRRTAERALWIVGLLLVSGVLSVRALGEYQRREAIRSFEAAAVREGTTSPELTQLAGDQSLNSVSFRASWASFMMSVFPAKTL